MRTMIPCVAIGLTISGGALRAAEPVVLTPASYWNIHYGDDLCRLSRAYGEPGRQTLVFLEQYEPGIKMVVGVAGPLIDSRQYTKPHLRFGPSGRMIEGDRLAATSHPQLGDGLRMKEGPITEPEAGPEPRARWTADHNGGTIARPLDPAAAAAITSLEIGDRGSAKVRIDLGSLKGPVAALNDCTQELMSHWNIDPIRHKTMSRAVAPATYPGAWVTNDDYPSSAMAKGTQGVVAFRLDVEETGKPTDCHIQQATTHELGTAVCKALMQKAKFTPALDGEGKPMKSYWRNSFNFSLE